MTNHPNRSSDREQQIQSALTFSLGIIARELDKCSPELRRLIRMACAGANGEKPCVGAREQDMAQRRLNEAATRWTAEAKAARKAAADLAFRSKP